VLCVMNFGFRAGEADDCDLVKRKHLLHSPFCLTRFGRGQPISKRPRSQTKPQCIVARCRRLDLAAAATRRSAGGTDNAEWRRRAAARGVSAAGSPDNPGTAGTGMHSFTPVQIKYRRREVDSTQGRM
jgi:hypothetical protein